MAESADGADVVVVGAGIAGASVAWQLAARGDVAVTIVEREPQPGQHATGRSAALLNLTSGSWQVCALTAASWALLEHPPEELGEQGFLSERGLLWVADRDSVGSLDSIAATATRLGVRSERLDAAAVTALVPAMRPDWVAEGITEPDAKAIDVAALLAGYLAGHRHHGGKVHTTRAVTGLDRVGERWRIETTSGPLEAPIVINAAGAWVEELAALAGLAPLGLHPLRRTAFMFPGPDDPGVEAWPMVMDIASRFYFEPETGGLLASPADEIPTEPCDARPLEEDVARAVDALGEATTLDVRGVRNPWAGLRTFAPDRLPVVGADPRAEGFFWLAGQGGAGIKTSPALGELAAAAALGAPPPAWLDDHGLSTATFAPDRLVG